MVVTFTIGAYHAAVFAGDLSMLQNVRGGLYSAVRTANRYGLDCPELEPRWGARFSAPAQIGPEVHPASCTVGTGAVSWG